MSFSVLDAAKSRTSIPGLAHCRLIIILATFSCFSLLSQAEPNSSAQLAWHTVGILGGIALKLRNADCCIPKVLAAGCNYCATGQPAYPYPDHAGLAFSVVKAGSIILGVVLGRELGHLICTPKRA
ncbi:MAG TPA: hypothetical protein VJJ83_03220, partial [Candidatus Babeliales bacterium]|nr:hypothetical protein [Candidatus Babeliales bacterium]